MKVLFATSSTDDYCSACLWDGLQELLGWENVYDAGFTTSLHYGNGNGGPAWRVGGFRPGMCLHYDDRDFDLLVLNAAILREHDWHWAIALKQQYLKPTGKVVWIEGNDHVEEVNGTAFVCDAVFRREMDGRTYPYPFPCYPLLMSAPSRWLGSSPNDSDRPLDVFAPLTYQPSPIRWECLSRMFQTNRRHLSIGASCSVSYDRYFDYLRTHKLCICPPGAGSDCMRHWEAAAHGCIPIFVCLPSRVRDPWFDGDDHFWCEDINDLPRIIDHALGLDLTPIRQRLLDRVRERHTTLKRAKRVLDRIGM